jgi:hypothetical protein
MSAAERCFAALRRVPPRQHDAKRPERAEGPGQQFEQSGLLHWAAGVRECCDSQGGERPGVHAHVAEDELRPFDLLGASPDVGDSLDQGRVSFRGRDASARPVVDAAGRERVLGFALEADADELALEMLGVLLDATPVAIDPAPPRLLP